MNRKLLIHLCILIALLCLAAYVWIHTAPAPEVPVSGKDVEMVEDLYGNWVPATKGGESAGLGHGGGRGASFGRLAVVLVLGIYGAVMFLTYGLPSLVQRATTEMLASGAEVETDSAHDARALFAQGDYAGAVEAYRVVADEHPDDRLPWVEMARIQNDKLDDPDAAIAILTEGLEAHEWTVNNAAFFLFRIAGLYEEEKQDAETTVQLLQRIVEMFPETRHSANATHRLRELGVI